MSKSESWTRRQFLERTTATALTATLAGKLKAATGSNHGERRPNILFIFPDEWRGQALEYMGQKDVKTPNLDQLASEGVTLPTTFANTPLCCPGRANMLTGTYPHKHGVRSNDLPLEDEKVTIAEILRTHGYRTGFIGKWHLDGGPRLPGYIPPGGRRQGFELWAANECRHDYFDTWYFRDSPLMIPIHGTYDAYTWTDIAIEFLKQLRSEQPFCLFVAYDPPHFPIPLSTPVAPPEYLKLYDPAKIHVRPNWRSDGYGTRRKDIAAYYGAITCLDKEVGRLMQAVDEQGLKEETIVLFTSDHGDMMGSHGMRMKRKPWEEAIRVPGIIRYPAKLKPGQSRDYLFSHVDMLPTLLGLAGLRIPSHLQGTDYSSGLLGKEFQEPQSVYFQNYMPYHDVGLEKMFPGLSMFPAWRAVRTHRYKYARTQKKPWLLYDLERDPYEMHNLVNEPDHRDIQQHMEEELAQRMRAAGDSWKYDFTEFIPLYNRTEKKYHELLKEIREGKFQVGAQS